MKRDDLEDLMIEGIAQKESYYAKLGNLFVQSCYPNGGSVSFHENRNEAALFLMGNQIVWLKENIPGITIIKVKLTIQEVEEDATAITF